MFFDDRVRGIGRRALAAMVLAACALPAVTASARADTTFGGNPTLATPPTEVSSPEGSCGPVSCTLYWTGPGGTDLAPIPAAGGSGQVTSVTLPAMPAPGTMQAVVLTSSLTATTDPAQPDFACCKFKEVSAPFTVPANAVTTVPLALHVAATGAVNLGLPGDSSTGDGVGISVLTPNASLPVRATENAADVLRFWAPALSAPTPSFEGSAGEKTEYELSAGFTFAGAVPVKAPPPSPGAGSSPTPGSAARAKEGVKLRVGNFRPAADGRTLTLGKATNPPTASTKQTLTFTREPKKPIVLGTGKTIIPNGKSSSLKMRLNSNGRALLAKKHSLKARLTVVATNRQGKSETVVRTVTIRSRRRG